MRLQTYSALVQPLSGGRFFVGTGAYDLPPLKTGDGAYYRELEGLPAGEPEVDLPEPGRPSLNNMDFWVDDSPTPDLYPNSKGHCRPDLSSEVKIERRICYQCGEPFFPFRGPKVLHYYHMGTGAELLRITVFHGDVKASISGETAVISGGGCQSTVELGN
jgi:hypothetical protein